MAYPDKMEKLNGCPINKLLPSVERKIAAMYL